MKAPLKALDLTVILVLYTAIYLKIRGSYVNFFVRPQNFCHPIEVNQQYCLSILRKIEIFYFS